MTLKEAISNGFLFDRSPLVRYGPRSARDSVESAGLFESMLEAEPIFRGSGTQPNRLVRIMKPDHTAGGKRIAEFCKQQ